MKIVITGSLGNIGKLLTKILLTKGHSLTVISSNANKQQEIEHMGASAAIGNITDPGFLTTTFKGADAVYLMEPPIDFFDAGTDAAIYWQDIAHAYKQAVLQSGVTKLVHLSSVGGHRYEGVGILSTHYLVESILKTLPAQVSIKTMRPVGFYYNMLAFIAAIKNAGNIFQNYGGDEKEPWVSPLDIAVAIAEEMERPFKGRTIHYIASDEVSPNEVAAVLGAAIGKNDLKWITITDQQFESNLLKIGFSPQAAKGLTEMNASRINGVLYEHYNKYKPELGKVKLTDFAKEFAIVYQSK